MSKHNYGAVGQEISYLTRQINSLSKEEVYDIYGIELLDDGRVFDPTYNKFFDSVGEWAQFNVEQDDIEYEEHFHSGKYNEDW